MPDGPPASCGGSVNLAERAGDRVEVPGDDRLFRFVELHPTSATGSVDWLARQEKQGGTDGERRAMHRATCQVVELAKKIPGAQADGNDEHGAMRMRGG